MKTRKIMTAAICGFSRPYSLYAHAPSGILVYGNCYCSAGRARTADYALVRGVLPTELLRFPLQNLVCPPRGNDRGEFLCCCFGRCRHLRHTCPRRLICLLLCVSLPVRSAPLLFCSWVRRVLCISCCSWVMRPHSLLPCKPLVCDRSEREYISTMSMCSFSWWRAALSPAARAGIYPPRVCVYQLLSARCALSLSASAFRRPFSAFRANSSSMVL